MILSNQAKCDLQDPSKKIVCDDEDGDDDEDGNDDDDDEDGDDGVEV